MWFESLMGFAEESPEQVRSLLEVEGAAMVSRVNGRAVVCGRLETPSLAELRARAKQAPRQPGPLRVAEVVADVQTLHGDSEFAGAVFQVASQFNLLEMTSPSVTPERGVGIYGQDATQGPACAIAAGGGTIYRNYFAPLPDGQRGQTAERQIDCAADLARLWTDEQGAPWAMSNGYLLPSAAGLAAVNRRLESADNAQRDQWRAALRIGLQWNVEVTLQSRGRRPGHCVSQAYCSAAPVAYSRLPAGQWEPLARLVLEAAYESTVWAALLPDRAGPSRTLFLTLLGGGAFGNPTPWIIDAIERALQRLQASGEALDVAIVSYGASRPEVAALARRFG